MVLIRFLLFPVNSVAEFRKEDENMGSFELGGRTYQTDEDGYLVNIEEWSKEVGEYLAKEEGLEMTESHWEVINFLREYYEEYKIAPMIKILVKAIAKKLGPIALHRTAQADPKAAQLRAFSLPDFSGQ